MFTCFIGIKRTRHVCLYVRLWRDRAGGVLHAVAPVRLLLVDPVRVVTATGRATDAGHGAVTQQT